MNERIRHGGLMRCCLLTFHEHRENAEMLLEGE